MNVIENLLPEFYVDEIINVLTDQSFPWFYTKETVYVGQGGQGVYVLDTPHIKECDMFSHSFFHGGRPTESFNLVRPALYYIQQKTDIKATIPRVVDRVKSNMLLRQPDYPVGMYNTPHIDTSGAGNFKTVLLYLNDSDGDTVFFEDGEECFRQTPKANTAVVFDSKKYHASTPPIVNNKRLVLNFVFHA